MDIVTPVLAGAAGAFIKTLADKGVQWLIELVGSHSAEVQKQAQENLQNFVIRLAHRVEQLETELPVEKREIFDRALGHPSTSLLFQKAVVNAATTDNDDRHLILSELIAERLTAGADDMVALVGSAACDVVQALASKHIRYLGMAARFFHIRPDQIPEIKSQKKYEDFIVNWWNPLEQLCSGLEDFKEVDFHHLIGLSCAYHQLPRHDFEKYIKIKTKPNNYDLPLDLINNQPWGPLFTKLWEIGTAHIILTAKGFLIGVLYHDSCISDGPTKLNW